MSLKYIPSFIERILKAYTTGRNYLRVPIKKL